MSKLTEANIKESENQNTKEDSKLIRERVIRAREIQQKRFEKNKGMYTNAQMGNKQVKQYCPLFEEVRQF